MDLPVFTIPQAAKLCAVSRWTLRNLVTSGQLKASRTPGGHYRILKKDLDSFIAQKGIHRLIDTPQKKRILIVDDDPRIRTLVQKILTGSGYDVECAEDGFDAGLRTMKFQPHLVILDLFMPKIDGFEVCRRLKTNPDTADTRVIAISGFATNENKLRILNCGAAVFLPKPLDLNILKQTIDQVLA